MNLEGWADTRTAQEKRPQVVDQGAISWMVCFVRKYRLTEAANFSTRDRKR